eukprot:scaffold23229_cov21-Tisochrysis_lutea.AAC.1
MPGQPDGAVSSSFSKALLPSVLKQGRLLRAHVHEEQIFPKQPTSCWAKSKANIQAPCTSRHGADLSCMKCVLHNFVCYALQVGGIYFGKPRGFGTNEKGERIGYNTMVYSESEVPSAHQYLNAPRCTVTSKIVYWLH